MQLPINRTTIWGMHTSNTRDALLRCVNMLAEQYGKAVACLGTDPNNPNWAALEAQFGQSAGNGEAYFTRLKAIAGPLVAPDPNVTVSQVQLVSDIRTYINDVG